MIAMPPIPATITDAARALRDGSLTSVELVQACLTRADILDPLLGVFIERLDATALDAAAVADAELASGRDRGVLHGIPLGVKDIIATRESTTTAQSLILDPGWGQQGDAPVVARLREAGAVIIGKTSTMEFAIGMPDASKPFPVPRNPWNTERWPGGSSSGTGAGVAAGLFLGGLGTDTGGSVRIPAAFCGISGLKQTFGLVPKSGCVPLGYSLDHIGPMARSVEDCAAMLDVMAGFDASDPTCVDRPVPVYSEELNADLDGKVIGVERANHFTHPGVAPECEAIFDAAVAAVVAAGATVVEFELPNYQLMRSAGVVTMRSEASSYHRMDLMGKWSDYGVHTSKAVSLGNLVSAADYVQAQRIRSMVNAEIKTTLAQFDGAIMPMTGVGAPLIEGLDHNSFTDWPIFSQYWNPTGLPSLAVPMGFAADEMPLSLQVVGPEFSESMVMSIGHAVQATTDWHLRLPPTEGTLLETSPTAASVPEPTPG